MSILVSWYSGASITVLALFHYLSHFFTIDRVRIQNFARKEMCRCPSTWCKSSLYLLGAVSSQNLTLVSYLSHWQITWCGGMTEARRIVALAAAYDIPIIPHGSSIYSYHLQICFPNCPLAEFLVMSPKADSIGKKIFFYIQDIILMKRLLIFHFLS